MKSKKNGPPAFGHIPQCSAVRTYFGLSVFSQRELIQPDDAFFFDTQIGGERQSGCLNAILDSCFRLLILFDTAEKVFQYQRIRSAVHSAGEFENLMRVFPVAQQFDSAAFLVAVQMTFRS